LNGEILPGVTRDSILHLTRAHIAGGGTPIPGLPAPEEFVVEEREFTLGDLRTWNEEGRLRECFACGTAAGESSVSRFYVDPDPPSLSVSRSQSTSI
jgi:branched-chain amino acid aminotransferase